MLYYECTSCQLTISSHQNYVGSVNNPPYFDDWKWSTDKMCIFNEVTLNALYVSLKLVDKSQQIQPKDLSLASQL